MSNQIDTDAKVIGGGNFGFGHSAIVRLSNTVMIAAHINDSNALEIHKSTDNGLNWVLKKTITGVTGCFNLVKISSTVASLACNKGGNVRYFNSGDSGNTWYGDGEGILDALSLPSADADDKVLLVYDSGISRLHLVYAYGTTIYGKYTDNNGDSWTNWANSRASITNLYDVDVSPITNYVYFVEDYGDGYVTWYNSIGAVVSTFKYGISGYTAHDAHIAIDSAGNRYLTYVRRNSSTSDEDVMVRRNEGSQQFLFSPGGDNIIVKGSTSISIDDDDNVYVFYTKTSDGKTYYRKYDAGIPSWGTETLLIADATNRINTEKHVLSGSNKLHFVYYKAP